jgi:hypothetical protein
LRDEAPGERAERDAEHAVARGEDHAWRAAVRAERLLDAAAAA